MQALLHRFSESGALCSDAPWGTDLASQAVNTIHEQAIVTHRRYTESLHASTFQAMAKKRATPDVRERFGFAVKARREELGLTQEELAGKAGIHRTCLSDVERGSRNLSLVKIERLAAALSLPMAELFRLVDRP
jgi:DNA-binding XRE family transcriptional regulator